VKSHQKIADGANGLAGGTLANGDQFGRSCAGTGDLDWDGVPDLAVGAMWDDTRDGGGGNRNGAVHILFLNANGTVKSHRKIADGMNGLSAGTLGNFAFFGTSCINLGDINGDGVPELGVGAPGDPTIGGNPTGSSNGALHILSLRPEGTIDSHEKIADGINGLPIGTLSGGGNLFGGSCALLGDLDGDGRIEVAVGSEGDNTQNGGNGGNNHGALYLLSLGDAPFTVTTAVDELDVTSTDGTGVSLREAIRDAGVTGHFRRILFGPALNGATITLGGTQIELVDLHIAIDASGLSQGLTISGGGLSRLFLIDPTSSLEARNVTLRNGSITSGSNPQNRGGAIQSRGKVHLVACTVEQNSAIGPGGGIDNLDGELRMENCTVSGNGSGGGGGGIHDGGSSWLLNCTLSGNEAAQDGGAIQRSGTESSRFFHVTISGNHTDLSGGGVANVGASSAELHFHNCIVAGNTASGGPPDISGGGNPVVVSGENLVGSNESVTGAFPASPLVGTVGGLLSPSLRPLGNYGGPTPTMPPTTGSPALEAGPYAPLPAKDQRGVDRNDGKPDLGAVEGAYQSPDNRAAKSKLRKKIRKLKKKVKNAKRRQQNGKARKLGRKIRKLTRQLRAL
jgi:hypothetical protein